MRRNTDPRPSVVFAFLLGAVLILHGLVAGALALRHLLDVSLERRPQDSSAPVEVELEPPPRPKPRPQVVEIDRPAKEKVPIRARYASEFNSSVHRQTQARNKGLRPIIVASVDQQPPSQRINPPTPPPPRPEPGVDLLPKQPSPLSMRHQAPRAQPAPRSKRPSAWNRKLSLRNLTPSNRTLQRVLPTAFPDYLKDIDFGDRTLLNTKEWRFASFFNRVKRAVAQHWHPDKEYSRRDPNGNVFGFKNRLTILHVLLRPDGRLKRIVLEHPSGLDFLDDEAVQAFRRAAPFPNPPHRLVNTRTHQIAFRFGFIFEVTRTPSWRIFRLK